MSYIILLILNFDFYKINIIK